MRPGDGLRAITRSLRCEHQNGESHLLRMFQHIPGLAWADRQGKQGDLAGGEWGSFCYFKYAA